MVVRLLGTQWHCRRQGLDGGKEQEAQGYLKGTQNLPMTISADPQVSLITCLSHHLSICLCICLWLPCWLGCS